MSGGAVILSHDSPCANRLIATGVYAQTASGKVGQNDVPDGNVPRQGGS